jgi:hypothetical protein
MLSVVMVRAGSFLVDRPFFCGGARREKRRLKKKAPVARVEISLYILFVCF